jgi:methyltransferase
MVSWAAYLALLGAIALERLYELRLSARNARWAFERGAREVGRRHYRAMTVLHSAFFVACALEVLVWRRPFPGALGVLALLVSLGAMALRYWAIATLGARWNTRIIVLPRAAPVTEGPCRFLRHPNYVAVVLELLFVPLIHGAYATAVLFTVANAAILFVRIRAEERALGPLYQEAFAQLPRFFPGVRRG